MGPKNACDYADVAMNYIDQAVHGKNPACLSFRIIPEFWARFRDDTVKNTPQPQFMFMCLKELHKLQNTYKKRT